EHAVEPRHKSFDGDAFLRLLARHGVAAVTADTAGRHVRIDSVTAPFAYVRLHGSRRLYASGYDEHELADWAARIRALPARAVWIFFDNDARAHAPRDAGRLRELLADLLPSSRAEDRDRCHGGRAGARRDRARRGAGLARDR